LAHPRDLSHALRRGLLSTVPDLFPLVVGRSQSADEPLGHPHLLRKLPGNSVFRGTRIPVYLIAELIAQGNQPAELIESYPRLTAEMIRLAPIYAAAYPLCVPRRKLPWRDQQPVREVRRKLS